MRITGRQGRLGATWALAAGLGLAGCGQTGGGETAAATPAAAAATSATGDVLAPEVFSVREEGLWDGRPSLGGVWVAHPDVGEPDRVRIVNAETGKEIAGALFRRERDLPGPALQVSSDAAVALGMLAGDPTPLEVTALRRQSEPEPAAVPEPAADPAAGDLVASAAAAIDAAEAPAPAAEAVAAPPPAPVVDPAEIERVADAVAAILAAAPAAEPAAAPADGPPMAMPEVADLPPAEAAPVAVAAPASPARPWWRLGGGASASAPMTALAPGAIATTALDAPPPAAEAAAVPTPAASAATYVQVGRFTVEANARELAQQLSAQGLPAGVVDPEPGVWLVWVGPATEPGEAEALLAAAVAAGHPDAYLVNG